MYSTNILINTHFYINCEFYLADYSDFIFIKKNPWKIFSLFYLIIVYHLFCCLNKMFKSIVVLILVVINIHVQQ